MERGQKGASNQLLGKKHKSLRAQNFWYSRKKSVTTESYRNLGIDTRTKTGWVKDIVLRAELFTTLTNKYYKTIRAPEKTAGNPSRMRKIV